MTDAPIPETFTGAATPAAAPVSLSSVTSRMQRPIDRVPLYLDAETASRIADAEAALEKAREYDETTNEPDTAPAIAQHLRDLEDLAEASKVVFVLQAITSRAYQGLRALYPPSDAQKEAALKRGGDGGEPAFDPDAFAPALVRGQLISPAVDSDEAFEEFWEELNDGQMQQLWGAAMTVQFGVTDPGPKSELASQVLASFGIR